jgi:hypothetical protein
MISIQHLAGLSQARLITFGDWSYAAMSSKDYTTKELKTPTVNTNNNQRLNPEKTRPLFSDQLFGEAKTTGTPTTKANDTTIKANKAS